MLMINYIQMLIFNVLQMPLSIYVKTETIIDMMYLQVLILMIPYNFSVPINYRYYL